MCVTIRKLHWHPVIMDQAMHDVSARVMNVGHLVERHELYSLLFIEFSGVTILLDNYIDRLLDLDLFILFKLHVTGESPMVFNCLDIEVHDLL